MGSTQAGTSAANAGPVRIRLTVRNGKLGRMRTLRQSTGGRAGWEVLTVTHAGESRQGYSGADRLKSALEMTDGAAMGRGRGDGPIRRRRVMVVKTLSVWAVLAVLVGGVALAGDDSGWAKRT